MNQENKRVAPRLELQFEGSATAEAGGKKLQMQVTTKDLNAYGAYLFTDAQPVGGKVKIRLEWTSENEHSEVLFGAAGTILRVDQLPDDRYGFAVEFENIDIGSLI